MLAVMRWIMDGNRGLVYVRVMRTPSAMLYESDYVFEFGKGHFVHGSKSSDAYIVSSSRGVHEAIAAARECSSRGINAAVVDLPSIDADLLIDLCASSKLVCLAEQNNGYILQNLQRIAFERGRQHSVNLLRRVLAINTLGADGRPRFIHSGTYEELIEAFGLTPSKIASAVAAALK
jgi:transketolase C-terminal domain/subunit